MSKSELLLEAVQFKVTFASPAVPLVAVAPFGDALSIVTVSLVVSAPLAVVVAGVKEVIVAVTVKVPPGGAGIAL